MEEQYRHRGPLDWPPGLGGKGNDGVTALVNSTAGRFRLHRSRLRSCDSRSAGGGAEEQGREFVYPNLKNIKAATQSLKKIKANNEIHLVNPPARFKNAVPGLHGHLRDRAA